MVVDDTPSNLQYAGFGQPDERTKELTGKESVKVVFE